MAKIKSRIDMDRGLVDIVFVPASSAEILFTNDPTNDELRLGIPFDMVSAFAKNLNAQAQKLGIDTSPASIIITNEMPSSD